MTANASNALRIWIWRCIVMIMTMITLTAAIITYANLAPMWAAAGRISDSIDDLPHTPVGLVLGTTDRIGGRENPYFRHRIDAAARLWQSGRISTLLVSGDNRSRYYNEPVRMREALVARGVPTDRIVCDYAGLRTFDSVVRAKEIFGARSVVFISQKFHVERAIYIATSCGIDARGYVAKDVEPHFAIKTRLREIGARVRMWLDVHVLDTQPRHLGQRIRLP
jgi:SanA protein